MYESCIFCTAKLGTNEAIETFPVGQGLAFDSWKGRLWAVCRRCGRWNLAPIEERWEATEAAERLFRDSRLRVHSENIGLAKLRDGTRLIRVGEALPREFAAWRYGDQLRRRRWRYWLGSGAVATGVLVTATGGLPLLAAIGGPAVVGAVGLNVVSQALVLRSMLRGVHRLPASESPTGRELVIRQQSAYLARLVRSADAAGLAVELPSPLPPQRQERNGLVRWVPAPPLVLEGYHAQRVLQRLLAAANSRGAGTRAVDRALDRIDAAGGREAMIERIAEQRAGLFRYHTQPQRQLDLKGGWSRFVGTFRGERIAGAPLPQPARVLARPDAMALEMLVNEDAERRALEGELRLLEQAWREAEEIAAIADRLPDDPLDAAAAAGGAHDLAGRA